MIKMEKKKYNNNSGLKRCAIPSCTTTSNQNIKLYSVRNVESWNASLAASNITFTLTRSSFVCRKHFGEECFRGAALLDNMLPTIFEKTENEKMEEAINKIRELIETEKQPIIVRSRLDWSCCFFEDEIFRLAPMGPNSVTQKIADKSLIDVIYFLLRKISEAFKNSTTLPLRYLYNKSVENRLAHTEEQVNDALHHICCLFDMPPWKLRIYPDPKGKIAGHGTITLADGGKIKLQPHSDGLTLPTSFPDHRGITTKAKYIVLVEKKCIFTKLLSERILSLFGHDCLLLTGSGAPDLTTRYFLRTIWQKYRLPIYVLTDASPTGIEIMLTYKHGSKASSYINHSLAVPSIEWIGINPSDVNKLNIVSNPLSENERKQIDGILKRPHLSTEVRDELLTLQETNMKAKLDSVEDLIQFILDQIEKKI